MDVRRLSGKVALVTGAGSGIGAALSIELARRGATLVLVANSNSAGLDATAQACQRLGARTWSRQVDVADPEAVDQLAKQCHAELEGIDLLCNNAGVAMEAHFLETSLADWQWILGVNLWGTIHMLKAFVPHMVERARGGHVVNVASAAAFAPMDSVTAYATSKAAVVTLSESLRMELAPHRIGVTAACPGVVNTPIVRSSRRLGKAAEPGIADNVARFFEKRGATAEKTANQIMVAVHKNLGLAPVAAAAPMYYLKRVLPRLAPWLMKRMEARIVGS